MSSPANENRVFSADELLPAAWAGFAREGPVRTFNPGLLRDQNGWIFAYRVVAPDGLRRIGICRLDDALSVVPESAVGLSDLVGFRPGASYPDVATRWFADPRLYRFEGRVFVYWNSGWHEPHNCQFVIEIDRQTLKPMGNARELVLRGERRKLEKNWTFFEPVAGGPLRAVYSITPHRVLQFSLEGDGDVVFEDDATIDWSIDGYPSHHGGLRGGAPPALVNGVYWNFCHSVHDGAAGYRYAAAAYCFAARHPFGPTERPIQPLTLGTQFGAHRTFARLNPAVGEVIYPCGAAWNGTRWLISHGVNDEYCAISTISAAAVKATLRPVA